MGSTKHDEKPGHHVTRFNGEKLLSKEPGQETDKIHVVPLIIDEIQVSEEPPSTVFTAYFFRSGENVFYPAVVYDRAFIYVGEHRVERTYVKRIGGTDFIYINDLRLVPIRGKIYGIVTNNRHIGIAAQLKEGGHAYTVLEEKTALLELMSYKTGMFSKKECSLTRVDVGLGGEKIYAIARAKAEKDEQCPDILIYEKSPNKYVVKPGQKLIPSGWNGEWYTYIKVMDKNIELHIINFLGKESKYKFKRSLLPESYLIPGSIISVDKDSIIMNNSIEIMRFDLSKQQIVWRKTYESIVYTPRNLSGINKNIVAFTERNLWIIDKETGREIVELSFDRKITAASLDRDKLFVALGDLVYFYELNGTHYKLMGKYMIPGTVNCINALEKDLLISYVSPGNIVKLIYADYHDALRLVLPTFKITSGSKVEYEFRETTPTIRVLKQIGPQISVHLSGSKMIILDRGSKPGIYRGRLQIETLGFLPIVDDIIVQVEKLETVFRKIKIQPRVIPGPMGPYIPVIIEPVVELDEIYMVIHTKNGELYGASNIIYGVPKQEIIIPVYVIWAKQGIHNAELFINAWNRRNLFRERLTSRIVAEYDIPTFYLRVALETARIWSPFNVDAAKITFESPGAEFTIIHDLKAGWNELDTHGIIPRRVRITLRSGITYIVERGASWIQLSRS